MKKLLSILLIVAMLIPVMSIGSFAASDSTKATWTFKASVFDAASSEANDKTNFTKGGATVYDSKSTSNIDVKPGQVVWITIHLKTGSAYYAGEFSTNVFYTNNMFKSAQKSNYVWNDSGKYTGICSPRTGAPYALITENNRKAGYPKNWSDSQKNSHEFYTAIMCPDVMNYSKTVANVDEDIVSFPIYVKSNAAVGTKGQIFVTQDDVCTTSNKSGKFYLNNYANGGDLNQTPSRYSQGVSYDTSKATLTFTVTNGSGEQPSGGTSFFTSIINFFKSIINFFAGLFGGKA